MAALTLAIVWKWPRGVDVHFNSNSSDDTAGENNNASSSLSLIGDHGDSSFVSAAQWRCNANGRDLEGTGTDAGMVAGAGLLYELSNKEKAALAWRHWRWFVAT